MAEALELEWQDIDLAGGKAILWPNMTKARTRRLVHLSPRVVAALAALPNREGRVIRRPDGKPYADRHRQGGGQVKTAWRAALRRARLDPTLRPHDLRHTWASWHYVLYKDLLRLRVEGGWASVALVERYAHLMPDHHAEAIKGWHRLGTEAQPHQLTAC